MRSKYLSAAPDGQGNLKLLYEYRGIEYYVVRYRNGYSTTLERRQHEVEQKKIDDLLGNDSEDLII